MFAAVYVALTSSLTCFNSLSSATTFACLAASYMAHNNCFLRLGVIFFFILIGHWHFNSYFRLCAGLFISRFLIFFYFYFYFNFYFISFYFFVFPVLHALVAALLVDLCILEAQTIGAENDSVSSV